MHSSVQGQNTGNESERRRVTSRPWLSVIVPVYNGARYLAAAVDSVLSQSDDSVEVVLSDDGSTDGSAQIAQAYARDARVVVIPGPRQSNWVTNTNRAVERSSGQLVTFLHQDDLWLHGRFESLRAAVDRAPQCTLWLAPTRFMDSRGRLLGSWRLPLGRGTQTRPGDEVIEHLLVQNFVGMPTPAFPRAAFDATGQMDESLWYTADWDLWIKLAHAGHVGISPNATTAFRLHALSQTMQGARREHDLKAQVDTVRKRHLPLVRTSRRRNEILRAGEFASALNAFASAVVARNNWPWRAMTKSMMQARFGGLRRVARDSRFIERSWARLRAGLLAGTNYET
jgi:glycosyltransferase involved in cell wall biosynthesis